jgi:hypothetical protein
VQPVDIRKRQNYDSADGQSIRQATPPVTVQIKTQQTTTIVSTSETKPAIKPKPKSKRIKIVPTRSSRPTQARQQEADTDLAEQWKATFMERELRKGLGEKEYRRTRARKNKQGVDQLMKSINESKKIEIED